MIHKWTFTVQKNNSSDSEGDSDHLNWLHSLSVVHPMNRRPEAEDTVTMTWIMDCSTITVHASKCYKALIDSRAAISLIRYPIYQHIDNSFKTPIQPTTATLNTADSLLMTALGMTALHLRIPDFKFTHNFAICNRLPDTELIFGIDIQKKFYISYA